MSNLLIVSLIVFLINLPCGYWRGGLKRMSLKWFIAIHLPIPFMVFLRIEFELGFQLYTYPIMVAAYFLSQFLGGMIWKWRNQN